MDDGFVGERRCVRHKKNHFGIIVVCMPYKSQRCTVFQGCCMKTLNHWSQGCCTIMGNGCRDIYGCEDDDYGWGISSLTMYHLTKFNSRFWTIISRTPRSSLSCNCAEIKCV